MGNDLLKKLEGGNRRSIGRVEDVVREVLGDPDLFGVLFDGMSHPDPLVRMHSADAVEKLTADRPEWLAPYKHRLLRQVAACEQQEVRWHAAQLFSRVKWTPRERRRVVEILAGYLSDESKIVKTFSMQALADIALQDAGLRPGILRQLEALTRTGSPAMRSRGRKLLAQLKAE